MSRRTKTKLGPTGDFPRGRLNEDDEGGLTTAIGEEDGNVVIKFGKEVAWVAMPPDQAIAFASTIVKHAMNIRLSAPKNKQ